MTDPTAEAVNWALERAATLAEEACPCGVGKKLAVEIRALKVEGETVVCQGDCMGTPEELEELDTLKLYSSLRGSNLAGTNLRRIEQEAPRAIVAADGPGDIAAGTLAADAIATDSIRQDVFEPPHEHEHDLNGPMVPVEGVYRFTCSCGFVHPA